jgi:hypothetical protein
MTTDELIDSYVAGAVLIPFGAILNELTGQPGPERNLVGQAIGKAWPGVLAWLGLLVVGFAVAAWARRRRPDAGWKLRPLIVLVTLIDLAVRTRRQNVRQAVEIR